MAGHRLTLRGGEAGAARRLADFVAALAVSGGLDSRQSYWLRLAVDEITTNIGQHGYRGLGGLVEIEGAVDDDRVWVRITDEAPAFDPHSHDPAPRLANGAAHDGEGGLGLYLALNGLDRLDHAYVDGRNVNTLMMLRHAEGVRETDGGTHGGDDRVGGR
ncbi:ATP-binding protein [Kutzneria chonburiensis]|uniref:ATP-binding protein n=1 Tax=Kutzneria chonburiensis TaxID=1483604 RepID=A0ABV6N5E0_9PSEU|nr:ATP-binding protein [Kutzneria chonburiensis]